MRVSQCASEYIYFPITFGIYEKSDFKIYRKNASRIVTLILKKPKLKHHNIKKPKLVREFVMLSSGNHCVDKHFS